MLTDRTGVAVFREPQCSAERLSALGKLEASGVGVQIGTSAWQPSSPVDGQCAVHRYDP